MIPRAVSHTAGQHTRFGKSSPWHGFPTAWGCLRLLAHMLHCGLAQHEVVILRKPKRPYGPHPLRRAIVHSGAWAPSASLRTRARGRTLCSNGTVGVGGVYEAQEG
jgi:hypothetical protein